jgi:predicted phage baseplate assembly protein
MVPADHGRWIDGFEPLGTVPDAPEPPVVVAGGCCVATAPVVARPPQFFPALSASPVTFTRPYDPNDPTSFASALTRAAAPDAPAPQPQITVRDDHNNVWSPEADLLGLDPLQRGFVLETERDGTAYLRFGDGEHGTAPSPGDVFRASYRVGNGIAGNIGRDTLGHVLTTNTRVVSVRNPLPAGGGRDPETMEQVRQRAPWAFRTQLRAVTEDDYGVVALRDAAIRAARGTLRWTGSWRTAFVALDPAPGAPPPDELARETLQRLELLRMAGVDTGAEPAVIVGLRVALSICVLPRYARGQVLQALQGIFTAGPTCDGRPGLLDPANFSFGQTVYLSPFIAAAQAVQGVASVQATAFQRVDDPARDSVGTGFITMQRLEIARIDNDPSRPDRGIFELTLDGGL